MLNELMFFLIHMSNNQQKQQPGTDEAQMRPIRKIIHRDDLPLPQAWANFIA